MALESGGATQDTDAAAPEQQVVAAWQFDITFVPRNAPAPVPSEQGYEVAPLPERLVTAAMPRLQSEIGTPWQMLPGWLVFGLADGNRIDVHFFEDAGDAQLSARLDARTDAARFIELVCRVAQELECRLYSPESGETIEPVAALVADRFSRSRAKRFVADPATFLQERP